MSDAAIVKPVTKSFNAAQSIWKMYLPVFITDVKDSLRPCDSPKVKAKFANAQRKMLTAWLTLMIDPKHMKTDHDDLQELIIEKIDALNSNDLKAEGLNYARMNEIDIGTTSSLTQTTGSI